MTKLSGSKKIVSVNNHCSLFTYCTKFKILQNNEEGEDGPSNMMEEYDQEIKYYKINYLNYTTFLEHYSGYIQNGNQVTFYEKCPKITYFKAHLEFQNSTNKKPYDQDFIRKLMKLYVNALKKTLTFEKLECFLCEKEVPTKINNDKYIFESELNFTNICISTKFAAYINLYVVYLADKNKYFGKDFNYTELAKSLNSVREKEYTLLYGSRTINNPAPYNAKIYYRYNNYSFPGYIIPSKDEIENVQLFELYIPFFKDLPTFTYVNMFSMRQGKKTEDVTPLNQYYINIDEIKYFSKNLFDTYINNNEVHRNSEYELDIPKLSITHQVELSDSDSETFEPEELKYDENDKDDITEDYSYYSNNKINDEDEFNFIRELIKLINNKKRKENYECYIIGNCLFNLDNRYLEDWIEYCKTNPIFTELYCKEEWNKFKKTEYGVITIHYYAKEDNPEKYNKMREQTLIKLYDEILDVPEHNTVAKLVYEELKHTHKCVNISKKEWYAFNKNVHKWEVDREGISIYAFLDTIYSKIKTRYTQTHLAALAIESSNAAVHEFESRKKSLASLKLKLNKTPFRTCVVTECARLFLDESFEEKRDENKFILGFTNGVYDFTHFKFRPGMPEDYITMNTGYEYVKFNKKSKQFKEVSKFMCEIMPDPAMRTYLMCILSTTLTGSIDDESLYVFTGSGANGKSKLMELMSKVLGNLYKPLDVRIITEKRGSSSTASPELADKKGIRLCPLDEPKHTDEINTGFMKFFTGGDQIMARLLYSNPIYFKPQFKPFLLCNKLPQIKADDDGTWRRIKVIEFLAKFYKNKSEFPKNPKKTEHLADNKLSDKLDGWKKVFCGILIQYTKLISRNNGKIDVPLAVRAKTNEYKLDSDCFKDFMNDQLMEDDEDKYISLDKLYDDFITWYRKNYAGKTPTKKEMKSYFSSKVDKYNVKTQCLCGYVLKFNMESFITDKA